MLRAVVDTNVLFEGLTKKGACAQVVDAWVAKQFVPCVSTALALEYEEVLTNKLGDRKRPHALGALQALLVRAEFTLITFTVRPASPDPDDDFVVDCAFNASAPVVTRNLKDFRGLSESIGVTALSPEEFVSRLRSS